MKLTLLSKQEYRSITLPATCMGQYWIRGVNAQKKLENIVAVEAVPPTEATGQGFWRLKSNRRFKILKTGADPLQSSPLKAGEFYKIKSADGMQTFVLYSEPLTEDRKRYDQYNLSSSLHKISIGRRSSNNICYDNPYVGSAHAELVFSQQGIVLQDLSSLNHTYVNGKACQSALLQNGDMIYMMGLQIVVTSKSLFVNNPDGKVQIQGLLQCPLEAVEDRPLAPNLEEEDEFENIEPDFYYRPPRFKYDVEPYELKIDAPPSNQNNDEIPLIMMIGPSMTMGMASVASGTYAVTSAIARGDITSAIPSIVMCFSMLLGTMMWPILTKSYQRKRKAKKEEKRQISYRAYLEKIDQEIAKEIESQEDILRDNDADINNYVTRILAKNPLMWERTPKHSDFLSLRLGYGNLPFQGDIKYPERRFTVEEDNLTELVYQFGEQPRWLTNVPICLPLIERFVSGIYGDKATMIRYAKQLILQIVALHSYDEVKLVLLYDELDRDTFSFTRWLPHTMDDQRTARYIATNAEETKELSSLLDGVIERRKNMRDSGLDDESPYYVMICLDKDLAGRTECVKRIIGYKNNLKFSVISMFPRLKDLPKECTAVLELCPGSEGNLTLIGDVSEPPIPLRLDVGLNVDSQQITRVLANTEVALTASQYALPKKYTFFEMLDIGTIEHLNLVDSWANHDSTKSLAATVGVDQYGDPFKLDLHEQAHGPHGLVAGMTGSGKSEFIITYLLSMAVNFHPNDVAFILIDYKGGGMAKSFENIPHTAGVITNLDGNGIKRALASMRSELHRRERIFREVSQKHNISNIDIYKYQKLFRNGDVKEPLPHLLIVSDEFAELKKEQPDFMTELTSTARVGRSLGVHLILATQKPGGVVDDQIRSNSRFRVCLKVQDNGDSTEMLGRTEAAALVNTGRFYLQVGNNELFEMGQSSWAGAPYYPSAKVIKDRDDGVSVINTNGRIIAEANVDRFAMFKNPKKQLDVVTDHIDKVCQKEQITRWKMWLDPIPSEIYLDALIAKYRVQPGGGFVLNPLVGEYDHPAAQCQDALHVPLSKDGNVVIYGSAGSGKVMFLESMCCSLIQNHTPEQVNLYILDFGAETMSVFAKAPHVGDVILSHETEKVDNIFKLLIGRMGTRKKLLAGLGLDMSAYNQQAEKPEANMVVVINNYAAFFELYENHMADLSFLTREGTKYGIYFVLACTGVNNVRFQLLQNFKTMYCLQLNNADDYSSVVGKTEGLFPENHSGRGLLRKDKSTVVEFQVAQPNSKVPTYQAIQDLCHRAKERHSNFHAKKVPVLPEEVTLEFLQDTVSTRQLSGVPAGVNKATLAVAAYDLTASPIHLVLSDDREWETFLNRWAQLLTQGYTQNLMVFAPYAAAHPQDNLQVYSSMDECVTGVRQVFATVLTRNNTYKEALKNHQPLPTFEPLVVIIQSMTQLKALLDSYAQVDTTEKEAADDTPWTRLQLSMSKCEKTYNVHFIVGESIQTLTPLTAEPWYKTHIRGNQGIWIGGGISNQYRLSITKKPTNFTADLDAPFGYVVENGTAILTKFLQ